MTDQEGTRDPELGPQCASDDAFTARMRRHQSWFRSHVLGVPCGTGPTAASTAHYGNMLRPEDAERGLNFLSPQIFEVAKQRLAQGRGVIEPFRLLRNMLSSQPMCFNLFGALVHDAALATRLLGVFPELGVAQVLHVKLEFAPEPRADYLGDGTAFDAFIEYRHVDGSLAFVGVETKLTESFSKKVYDGASYRRWMSGAKAPWRVDAVERVAAIAHNQLWRDHLLAVALRDHGNRRYEHGALMLVRHPEDKVCSRVVRDYGVLLLEGDQTFLDVPLDRLVALWQAELANETGHAWLPAFRQRYVSLADGKGAR